MKPWRRIVPGSPTASPRNRTTCAGRLVAQLCSEAAYSVRLPVMLKGPFGCGKTRFASIQYSSALLITVARKIKIYA